MDFPVAKTGALLRWCARHPGALARRAKASVIDRERHGRAAFRAAQIGTDGGERLRRRANHDGESGTPGAGGRGEPD
jgi:hypothetical protein